MEILLVEDNDDDILLMREAFAKCEKLRLVDVVRDGEQALAYLRRNGTRQGAPGPDMVFLDINLPRKNGIEMLQELKADPALRHLPVVILTVSEREEDILKAYAHGACSYLRKPEDFDQLAAMMKRFEGYWTLVSRLPARRC